VLVRGVETLIVKEDLEERSGSLSLHVRMRCYSSVFNPRTQSISQWRVSNGMNRKRVASSFFQNKNYVKWTKTEILVPE
jgi:hypothetical protein